MSDQSPYEGNTTRVPQYTPPDSATGPARVDDEPIFAPRPRRGGGLGRLLIGVGIILLLASLLGGRFGLSGGFVERTITSHQEFEARALRLDVGGGDVTIERGDDREIVVDLVQHGFGWTGSAAERSAERVAPEISQAGNTVMIEEQDGGMIGFGRSPYVEYRIRVPEDAAVTAEAGSGDIVVHDMAGTLALRTGSGDLTISDFEGELTIDAGSGDVEIADAAVEQGQITTGSGDVEMREVRGALTARAGSGNIEVEQADALAADLEAGSGDVSLSGSLADDRDSRFQTGSGNIRLRLPDDADATVEARADSGRIRSDWELSGDERERSGEIGDGGPDLSLHSGSGNIEIEQD